MRIAGKFEVTQLLGRGGFGLVYEAVDVILERPVAVKTIRHDVFSSQGHFHDFKGRFHREARAAARLNHPSIVAIYEAGEHDGVLYLAMELVRGGSLRGILRARQSLPVEEALAFASQLLDALGYAHEHGVVHRDVKPENILVAPEGRLKIADFGLARTISDQAATLTQDGTVMGTPGYMAPEHLLSRPVDRRTDLFSASAVLYELIAGRRPFRGESLPDLLANILHAEPDPIDTPGVPDHVVAAIMRGLRKRPEERFSCGREMLAAMAPPALPRRPSAPARSRIGQRHGWGPPPDVGPVTLSGPLERVSAPAVILDVSRRRLSGLLVVETPEWCMGLDFEDGLLVGASGGPDDTCLGDVLVRLSLLAPTARDRLVGSQRGPGSSGPLGELSVRRGILTGPELLAALEEQRRARVEAVVCARRGGFRLHRGSHVPEWRSMAGESTTELVVGGLRRNAERRFELVGEFLTRFRGSVVEADAEAESMLHALRLGSRAQRWLRSLHGRRLEDACRGLPAGEGAFALYVLHLTGMVHLSPANRADEGNDGPRAQYYDDATDEPAALAGT